MSLEPLLNPRSIAMIGASDNAGRIGGMPLELLSHFGFAGEVYPVNPKYTEVFGYRCYAQVEDLPAVPDLAVLAIGARDVTAMLRRCHAIGIRAAVVYAAGFAEEGAAGVLLQQELVQFCRESGMQVAGPNCMGLANLNTRAFTAFAAIFKTASMQSDTGCVSVLTQSGNVCSALYGLLRAQDLPVSHFINTGNEATVDFAQYLAYLAEDPHTEIVLGYVEQIRDGRRFIDACRRFQMQGKVLVVLKAGVTEKGAVAVQSHTSALAGDQKIYEAAFRDLNVIAADDFAQMANIAMLARLRHRTAGARIGVVTMSGALGAILTDRFIQAGLQLPDLPDDVQAQLRQGIPAYGMVGNPVDVTGNIVNDPQFIVQVLQALAVTSALDTVVINAPGYMLDRMAQPLIEVVQKYPRLFVAIDTGNASCRQALREAGVAVFDDLGHAVRALGPFLTWQERRRQRHAPIDTDNDLGGIDAQPVAGRVSAAGGQVPMEVPVLPCHEVDARRYLAGFGLPDPDVRIARTCEEAAALAEQLGVPLAMKVVSADLAHKTEAGGVLLSITGAQAAAQAYEQILENCRNYQPDAAIAGVMITPMQQGVAELLVGATRDPVFGPVLTVALGGIMTEIYRDTAHALLPVTHSEAVQLLRSLKAFALLDGFRGRPRADVDAVAQAMVAVGHAFLAGQPTLDQIEINPLLVRQAGSGVVMLDALLLADTAVS
ncbi:Acetyl-CoA synthetase [Advenella kashmirensis WT001]|uniref:Acetyl-CoA synthetase n=1 Tax=Advenella kashmirensis (strain DSM 17095 / LMG 22695 / WT001) TaxID=1036672 RepID=I3U7P4_ADVKW|nr:acetate--CoA ligase family protein [Advenella kashmirensis]AFK61032.1 Acetyl-CoA synthetase [Advenella kashmirensis WT001]